jgi:hypothetical protein
MTIMRAYIQSSVMVNDKRLICRVRDGVGSIMQTIKPSDNNDSETHRNTRDKQEMVSCISS